MPKISSATLEPGEGHGTHLGAFRIRSKARTRLTLALILKAKVPAPITRVIGTRHVKNIRNSRKHTLRPPLAACSKHCHKSPSSTTCWPLSLQTIFRASFRRSWWFASATRFSKEAMALLVVNRRPLVGVPIADDGGESGSGVLVNLKAMQGW